MFERARDSCVRTKSVKKGGSNGRRESLVSEPPRRDPPRECCRSRGRRKGYVFTVREECGAALAEGRVEREDGGVGKAQWGGKRKTESWSKCFPEKGWVCETARC